MNGCYEWNAGKRRDKRPLHIRVKLMRMNQIYLFLSQQLVELNCPSPIGHTVGWENEGTNSTAFTPLLKPPRTEQTENGSKSLRVQ